MDLILASWGHPIPLLLPVSWERKKSSYIGDKRSMVGSWEGDLSWSVSGGTER